MSLLNASNASNASSASRAHAVESGDLALALTLAREAIVGGEAIEADPAALAEPPVACGPAARLRALAPEFAQLVLLAEQLEILGQDAVPPDAAAARVTVTLRDAAACPRPLVELQAPSGALLGPQMKLVAGYADLRLERLAEIRVQRTALIPFFATILPPLAPPRAQAILPLLHMVELLATAVVQRAKLSFATRRPVMLSDRLQPLIDTPAHGSFPSGHATQAFALASVLSSLSGADPAPRAQSQLYAMAARIAINRTVAGVHYPIDSAAGAYLGLAIGAVLAARAGDPAAPPLQARTFDPAAWVAGDAGGNGDFTLVRLIEALGAAPATGAGVAAPPAPLLADLWGRAAEDWGRRWL